MRCAKCGVENPAGKKFCGDCGAPLANLCPKCGANNPAEKRFCGDCGAPISASDREPVRARVSEDGERRHLTVVFCDLIDSTPLAHLIDPEESREIVVRYQRAATRAIEAFDGHVVKYLGDGVMACFGYPRAHEDDAERAVRAALAVLDALSALARDSGNPQLFARIGVHTGPAVVAAGGDAQVDVFGDTPNVASRVQTAAEPNSILVTEQTWQLISGAFVGEDRGAHQLKGIEESVHLYRIVQASESRSRLRLATAHGPTPFVGRDEELRLLMNRWELARLGEGQVVLISGEAGIGKSRLVLQFRERLGSTPCTWIRTELSPYLQNTPFASLADIMRQSFGWSGDESVEAKLSQVEHRINSAGHEPAEVFPLIAPMLNLPVPEKYPPLRLSPEQTRKRLLAALTGWRFAMARQQPTVLVLEDLHWSDPSTLELQHLSVEQGANVPLLLVYTARPEFRPPWPMLAHHAQITLGRLRDRDIREMVASVAADTALSKQVVDTLASRSSGVPLFIEELTRAVVEGGERGAGEIPESLHNSLIARLDRLGPEREIAQVASVIGGEFSYELLSAISPTARTELESALRKLVDTELIYARGIPPDATYQFKHALIRDAAYDTLLKSRRKDLHRQLAQTISESFPALTDAQPEMLARHWTEAGETEHAIASWRLAAEQASARTALSEAETNYRKALAVLNSLPESAERNSRELGLQTALGTLLLGESWGAEKRETVLRRAFDLSGSVEHTESSVVPMLIQLGQVYIQQLRLDEARLVSERTLISAGRLAEPVLEIVARHNLREVNFWAGDLRAAHRLFEQALVASEGVAPEVFIDRVGYDWWTNTAGLLNITSVFLGQPEPGIASTRRIAERANANTHAFSRAGGLLFAADTEHHRGKALSEFARDCLDHCRRIATEHGFGEILSLVEQIEAWDKVCHGDLEGGITQMRSAMAELEALSSRIMSSWRLALIAIAQTRPGDYAAAEATCREGFEGIQRTGERWCEPELYRIWGEVMRARPGADLSSSEHQLRKSIGLSREQGSKFWELRTTTNLARLLRDTNRRDEARAMLHEIYSWFTEGFDTADLKDARAVLDELST